MEPHYTFTQPDEFKKSSMRAVSFLEKDGSHELDAKEKYEALSKKASWATKTRIDYWIEGNNAPPKYFHGYDEQKYRECFVFKRDEDRFYGFKCHPRPKTAARLEMCVLTFHDSKFEAERNYTLLDRINVLRKDPYVIAAIRESYPEFTGE